MEEGICSICGEFKPLSFDHIPPKGCVTPDIVDLIPLAAVLTSSPNIKHVGGETEDGRPGIPEPAISQNGFKCRSLCLRCNNNLLGGKYDPELKRVALEVAKITRASEAGLRLPQRIVQIDVQTHVLMKSVIGHLLATSSYARSDFYEGLRDYFLSEKPLPDTVDFYYWCYPYRETVSAKGIMLSAGEAFVIGDLLKFYPLGFFVADSGVSNGALTVPKIISCGCSDMGCRIALNFNCVQPPPEHWPELPDHPGRATMMFPGAGVKVKKRKRRTRRLQRTVGFAARR